MPQTSHTATDQRIWYRYHSSTGVPWDQLSHYAQHAINREAGRRAGVETVLDTIETTVDCRLPKGLGGLRAAKEQIADKLDAQRVPGSGHRYVQQLRDCSTLWAAWDVDGKVVPAAYKCKHRECPICADVRRKLWYHRCGEALALWTAPKHVTLTLRHSDDPLDQQLDRLISCFRRLRQRRIFTGRNAWGIWTIEVKRSKAGTFWHPHIHVIMNSAYVPYRSLKANWQEITGDSWNASICSVNSDLAAYIAKYVAKTSTMFQADVDLWELLAAVKGRRLVNKFGRWPVRLNYSRPSRTFLGQIPQLMKRAHLGDSEARSILAYLQRHHAYCLIESSWTYLLGNTRHLRGPPDQKGA